MGHLQGNFKTMKKTLGTLLALTALSAATTFTALAPANAQEAIIDELRFGGTWAQPDWLDNNHTEGDQAGINVEVLFKPVNIDFLNLFDDPGQGFVSELINPRFHLGAMGNLDEDGTSYAYAGLTWHFAVTNSFFVEAGFGGALNNGSDVPTATRAGIGSNLLFRESIGLGFNVTENMTIIAQYEHLSHRDLAGSANRGLNNISMKVGFKF